MPLQAEMTMKQIENLSPPIMKQVLPLVEQLPPLYMDLVKGREDFTPKPDETRRLVCKSYHLYSNFIFVVSNLFLSNILSHYNLPKTLYSHAKGICNFMHSVKEDTIMKYI